MNTIRSVGYGWGILIVAGGGSYYFAKRSINADREERAAAEEKRRQIAERLRAQEAVSRDVAMSAKRKAKLAASNSDRPSPSQEGASDPASASHADDDTDISRYESTKPFRSKKGDRFS